MNLANWIEISNFPGFAVHYDIPFWIRGLAVGSGHIIGFWCFSWYWKKIRSLRYFLKFPRRYNQATSFNQIPKALIFPFSSMNSWHWTGSWISGIFALERFEFLPFALKRIHSWPKNALCKELRNCLNFRIIKMSNWQNNITA